MLETHRLRFHADLKRGGEDETFRLTVLPHASRLLFIPDCLYYYRLMRRGSLSRHCDDITHAQCVQEFPQAIVHRGLLEGTRLVKRRPVCLRRAEAQALFHLQASAFQPDDLSPEADHSGMVA